MTESTGKKETQPIKIEGVYRVFVSKYDEKTHFEFLQVLLTIFTELIDTAGEKEPEENKRRVLTFFRCGLLFDIFSTKLIVFKDEFYKIPKKDIASMLTKLDPDMTPDDREDPNAYLRHMCHPPMHDPTEYEKIEKHCHARGFKFLSGKSMKYESPVNNNNNNNNNKKE